MRSKKLFIIAALLLPLVVTLVYWNHFDNAFVFDDVHTIVNNSYIRSLYNIPLFFEDAATFSSLPANQSYRPLLTTTLAIDYWLGGGLEDTYYFHLSTFIWFLVQGLFMYLLFKLIMDKARPHPWNRWLALFAVAWYLLHTANAETINYVIARSDSLSTLAVVVALYIYAKDGWGKKYMLYLLPFIAGLLIKPPAIMFAPILLVYAFLFEVLPNWPTIKAKPLRLISNYWGVWATLAVSGGAYILLNRMNPDTFNPILFEPYQYHITQPYVLLHYFKSFFLPTELSADTDLQVFESVKDIRFWMGTAFVVSIIVACFYTIKHKYSRPVSFGIAWFFLACLPTSLVPLSEVMNDHRMFFPFVGLVLSVVWSIGISLQSMQHRLSTTRKAALGLVAVLLLSAYSYGTFQRNEVWHDGGSLWLDVTIKSPENGRGLMNYGLAQMRKGNNDPALEYFQRALEFTPSYTYLHINLGIVYNAKGDVTKAEQYLQGAVSIDPSLPEAHFYYGRWLFQQARYEQAIFHLNRTLELSPAHQEARNTLLALYYTQKNYLALKLLAQETLKIIPDDELAQQYLDIALNEKDPLLAYEQFVAQNPSPENHIELSLKYYQAGEYMKCIDECLKALSIKEDHAIAYNNICSAYNALEKWEKAIEACEKAIEIEPTFERAKNNLDWAKRNLN